MFLSHPLSFPPTRCPTGIIASLWGDGCSSTLLQSRRSRREILRCGLACGGRSGARDAGKLARDRLSRTVMNRRRQHQTRRRRPRGRLSTANWLVAILASSLPRLWSDRRQSRRECSSGRHCHGATDRASVGGKSRAGLVPPCDVPTANRRLLLRSRTCCPRYLVAFDRIPHRRRLVGFRHVLRQWRLVDIGRLLCTGPLPDQVLGGLHHITGVFSGADVPVMAGALLIPSTITCDVGAAAEIYANFAIDNTDKDFARSPR